MKKLVCITLALCSLCLFACEKDEENREELRETKAPVISEAPLTLPIEGEMRLSFQRDMGGSFTDLMIRPDGTFRGRFFNDNPGESGVGAEGTEYAGMEYDGTEYFCDFSGKFINIEKKNEYAYSMTLSDFETEEPIGKEWIGDGEIGTRYVVTAPYGIENGNSFTFYTPNAPLAGLPEGFLDFWPGRENDELKNGGVLGMYGVYNEKTGQGYFEAESGEGE